MTTSISEVIRGWLGWCPQGSHQKIRTYSAPEFEGTTKIPGPAELSAPTVPGTTSGDHVADYQENILLILLLVAGLIVAFRDLQILAAVIILTAVAVYYDAKNIHAGRNFEKESILGNVVTWRPFTWGILVLVGWIIFLAIYLFSRKEIFHANH
ncbi:MAG: hypothetical protein LUQ01_05610 [Methanolinea sp.]|nr:hypothetical protein [Methanolinea sp.]